MLCDTTGYTTIPNANSNIFTPTNTGDYAVLIINSNCTVITDCLSFNSPFGLDEENAPSLYCYPNPNTSRKLFFSVNEVEVSTDLSGRVLLEKQRINQTSASLDLSDLPAGIYLVQAEYSEKINLNNHFTIRWHQSLTVSRSAFISWAYRERTILDNSEPPHLLRHQP